MVSKRRKQLIGTGIAALIVVGAAGFFARDAFAYTYYGGVTATAEGSGAMTGNDPSPIDAQQSYDLTANGTKLWEINKYPVNTTADITTNKGYLFVSRSELPANNVDGQQTSFSGGWGNPGFVEHVLLNGSQHMWLLQNSGGANPFTDGNSDYIAFSDVNDMNGMYDTTPFNVEVNGQTQAFYEPQTAINLGNKPLPHITTPLLYTAPSGGSQVSSIATGNTYYLSPSMFTAYGFNGSMYSQNYFAAYWVPIVNGQPDTSATTYAFSENDNGQKTVYDWPGTGTVINNGGLDSASANPYGSGFMNDFELVSDTSAPSTGQLEVFLPGSFPSGTSSVDLVAYYGDGVQRYDAQIANFALQSSVLAPTPTLSLSVTPTTSQTVGKFFEVTATVTNVVSGDKLYFYQNSASASPMIYALGQYGREDTFTFSKAESTYTKTYQVVSNTAGKYTFTAALQTSSGITTASSQTTI